MPVALTARRAAALGVALAAGLCAAGTVPARAASPSLSITCSSASVSVPRNQPVHFTLDCSTSEGDPVDGFTLVSSPSKSSAFEFDTTSGRIDYTAKADAVGSDMFRFKAYVTGVGESDVATATLDLQNTAPTCSTVGALSVRHDHGVEAPVVCTDPDGDALQVHLGTQGAAHGQVSFDSNRIAYTPAAHFVGGDAFSVVATDGVAQSAEVPVTVSVTNARPTCTSRVITVRHDRAASLAVTCVDADGDKLVPAVGARPQHGSVSIVGGRFLYQPARHYLGRDTFTFSASDGLVTSAGARDSLTVTNSLPSCERSASFTTRGRYTFRFDCRDADGDRVAVRVVKRARHGAVYVVGNRVTYVPKRRYAGRDSFSLVGTDGVSVSSTRHFNVRVRHHR